MKKYLLLPVAIFTLGASVVFVLPIYVWRRSTELCDLLDAYINYRLKRFNRED